MGKDLKMIIKSIDLSPSSATNTINNIEKNTDMPFSSFSNI
jgi:hypothetical protein